MRGVLWRLLGMAVGVTIVALLVRALGPARILLELRRIGLGFLAVLAVYLVANVGYALPLGVLLEPEVRVRARALVAGRLAAVAVNAATPLFGVGGEPVRLLWIPPGCRRAALAGLLVDRGAFLAASAVFLALGAGVAMRRLSLGGAERLGLCAVAALALLLVAVLYGMQRWSGVAGPLARLVRRLAPRRGQTLVDGAREIDARVRTLHGERPRRFGAAVALHLAGRAASSGEALLAAHFLGLGLGPAEALILTALPLATDFVLSAVPSQIGFHEGATVLLAGALGAEPAAGMAIALVGRLRQVVFVAIGFGLLSLRRAAREEVGAQPSATSS